MLSIQAWCDPRSQNGGFTLKTHQMFSVHTTPAELKSQRSPVILDLCLRKTWSRKSRDYRDVIVFEKLCFQNVFRPHENEKPAFSNSTGLKSILEKLRFRDGLVWTVDQTVEIKLRFQISPA